MQYFIGVGMISRSECRLLVGPFSLVKENILKSLGRSHDPEHFQQRAKPMSWISRAQENSDSDLEF